MSQFNAIDLFGEIIDADDANALQEADKVTTVDSTSTDDKIPTAKAVYDAILAGQVTAFKVTEFELPAGCTDLYMDQKVSFDTGAPYGVTVTASVSGDDTIVETDDNYPLNAIHISNLTEAPTWQDFKYDDLPAQWSDIAEMLVVSTPTDAYVYLKVAIYHSGGTDLYDYVRYRILYVEPNAAGDLPPTKYVKVWDSLTLFPEVNVSGKIDRIVLNGTERAIEDSNAADKTLSNLTDASNARDNLGLGNAATLTAVTSYVTSTSGSSIATMTSLRVANAMRSNESYVTNSSNSVSGADLYKKVFRASTTVSPGGSLTLDSATPYTDVVAMYAVGKDTSGYYHSIECYTDPDWCIKNTSGETLTEVTLVAIYSKS